jgi:hypothetical protein
MERVGLKTSALRPTENRELDLNRVHQLLIILKCGREICPITIVRDEHGIGYIVFGHEELFAACYVNAEINANVLKTDLDVSSCRLGRAGRFTTIADLVEDCKSGNEDCMRKGINTVADYKILQPMNAHISTQH